MFLLILSSGMLTVFVVAVTILVVVFAAAALGLKAARRGAKAPARTASTPGRITGATVTADQAGASAAVADSLRLALHIEFDEDGRRVKVTDPPRGLDEFDRKVRAAFTDPQLRDSAPAGTLPLKIEDPDERQRAEVEVTGGGSYEFVLDEPLPILVFRTDSGGHWRAA